MLLELSYYYCLHGDDKHRIRRIADSGLGAPNIMMQIDGKLYTIHFLRYFLQYLYLRRFVDFDNLDGLIEIGGGYGGMAEVVLKLHPDLDYVDVDIPPQIYLATQYLSACFEGEVVSYDETRRESELHLDNFSGKRVLVLCPWQLPKLTGRYGLFINSASFQEMEPEVVKNYAEELNRLVSHYGYIRAMPEGAYLARRPGQRGVLRRTTREDYVRYFHPFELTDETPAEVLPNLPGTLSAYHDFFFVRRS